jgi:flagellar motor switch protein FliG
MTLDRFRKKGGFLQLVQIVESTEPSKRKNLLHLVASEDPGWAHLIRLKVLSLDRILTWPREVLASILVDIPDSALIPLICGGSEDVRAKILLALERSRSQKMLEHSRGVSSSPAEQFAASVEIIQYIRGLVASGHLDFSFFDPSLVIDEKIAA